MRDTRGVKATGLQGDTVDGDHRDPRRRHRHFGDRAHEHDDRRRRADPAGSGRLRRRCPAGPLRLRRGDLGVERSAEGGARPQHDGPPPDQHAAGADDDRAEPPPVGPVLRGRPVTGVQHPVRRRSTKSVRELLRQRHLPVVGNRRTPRRHRAPGSRSRASPAARTSIYAVDAYRVATGEQSIAISHMPTGQSVAQFSVNRSVAVTLTSFGRSDEDLVRLAQSVTVEGCECQADRPVGDPRLPDCSPRCLPGSPCRATRSSRSTTSKQRRQRRHRADVAPAAAEPGRRRRSTARPHFVSSSTNLDLRSRRPCRVGRCSDRPAATLRSPPGSPVITSSRSRHRCRCKN